jgi:hypothetical protein
VAGLPGGGQPDQEFAAGTRVTVRFEFHCQLFPACTSSTPTDGRGERHRHLPASGPVDAVAFCVQPDASRKQSGYVDFAVRVTLIPATERNDAGS